MLSDPQERAWYDRHREQILKGSGSEYEDNALCVFQYFTASCYAGFGDDEKGFYTIFRDVFDQLASEEIEHLESEAEYEAIPKFGDSKSDYEEVVQPFYAFWQSFCTNKSKHKRLLLKDTHLTSPAPLLLSGYAWLSTHNINDIRDRRILKVVEKENKKVQQKARKERNEEIRGLVSFVRKRDKRVQAQRKVMEDRAAENRKRQAQLDLEQVLRRKQELAEQVKQSNIVDHEYEERLRQLEKGMQSTDDDDGEQLADQFQDVHIDDLDEVTGDCEFFCVACNKTFKNQSSYRNHESSKKHKENVELIKKEMLKDEVALHSEDEKEEEEDHERSTMDKQNGELELEEEEIVQPSSSSKGKKKKQKGKSTAVKAAVLHRSDDDDEEDEEATNMFLGAAAQQSDDDDWGVSSNKSKAKSKAKPVAATKKEKKKKGSKTTDAPPAAPAPPPAQKQVEESSSSDNDSEVIDLDHKCVTCAEQFSSKNKLFMHLKKTNHGVYIPKGKVVTQADVPELRRGKGGKRKWVNK